MSNTVSDSKYIVLDVKIAQNVKTKRDELELLLFDLNARADEDCIVDVTASSWQVNRREAQSHETEKALKIISSQFLKYQEDS